MYKDKRVIALIPARGRNDNIKYMNMRELGGRPLIHYTIKTALSCGFIDRVFVSTEDVEIAEYARKMGVDIPFLRSPILGGKHVLMEAIIAEVLRQFEARGERFDFLLNLYPNAPLKTRDLIVRFLDKAFDYDYVIPLFGHKNYFWRVKEDGEVELLFDNTRSTRENATKKYEEKGGIYAYNIAGGNWKDTKNCRIGYCELDFHESGMINTIYDLIMLEGFIKLPNGLINELLKYE